MRGASSPAARRPLIRPFGAPSPRERGEGGAPLVACVRSSGQPPVRRGLRVAMSLSRDGPRLAPSPLGEKVAEGRMRAALGGKTASSPAARRPLIRPFGAPSPRERGEGGAPLVACVRSSGQPSVCRGLRVAMSLSHDGPRLAPSPLGEKVAEGRMRAALGGQTASSPAARRPLIRPFGAPSPRERGEGGAPLVACERSSGQPPVRRGLRCPYPATARGERLLPVQRGEGGTPLIAG